eukprot:scaffold656891_cov45-Prasinocladus_malaysianus.AAC.1
MTVTRIVPRKLVGTLQLAPAASAGHNGASAENPPDVWQKPPPVLELSVVHTQPIPLAAAAAQSEQVGSHPHCRS